MDEVRFRFQDLEIWKRAAKVSLELFALSNELDKKHMYRFAEQLRAATLSISNNIAEGSGSRSKVDFANFLNISRRSVFEVANILLLLSSAELIMHNANLLAELEEQSRMIHAFIQTLLRAPRS
jgi:four helix bundle protein